MRVGGVPVPRTTGVAVLTAVVLVAIGGTLLTAAQPAAAQRPEVVAASPAHRPAHRYPVHTRVVATTFWVGEVFDATAPDGSQVISTYDARWLRHYGGCDGRVVRGVCRTERRFAGRGWFPRRMTPRENPFYLDLPFDDVNNRTAFARRCEVVPWAGRARYRGRCGDHRFSFMKNRWVALRGRSGRLCYGQVEDAGPGRYHDARYVFGRRDARPQNRRYGGAGLDVSPALNGCLGFRELNGQRDRVRWRFVDGRDVPRGPWRRIVTRRGVVG